MTLSLSAMVVKNHHHATLLVCRPLSTSNRLSDRSERFLKKPFINRKWKRLAQTPLNKDCYYPLVVAQKARKKWEYPVAPDQRASWRHSQWYDPHYQRWVSNAPEKSKEYNLLKKEKRTALFEAYNTKELLELLLKCSLKKYIIKPFDHEFASSNLSYYYQYLSNTKYIHGMPYCIENANVSEEKLSLLRSFVEDQLMSKFHSSHESIEDPITRKHKETKDIFQAIFHFLITLESKDNPRMTDCEVDYNQENSMFWLRGNGFLKWTIPGEPPVLFQTHDNPLLQIRNANQLPEFSNWLGEFSMQGEIPTFPNTPHVFGVLRRQYRNLISPGYPESSGDAQYNYQIALDNRRLHEFTPPIYNEAPYGHTQLHVLPETYTREWYEDCMEHGDITPEIDEHLKALGIMSGWTWNAAQATYDMHWMDKDITKPYCSQDIVTDGQWISFYCYQLNTIAIDPENAPDNPLRNLCYGKTSMKLYEGVTPSGVIGLNEEALVLLLKLLGNAAHGDARPLSDPEAVEQHDASLIVQEPDPDLPIEMQMPLHKVELARKKLEQETNPDHPALHENTFPNRVKALIGL